MEEKLREELKQIWRRKHNGEITKEEYSTEVRELIHVILEVNPQRILDLCRDHISGLPDENLLRMAKDRTDEFVFMNISAGAYHYSTVTKNPPHPDSNRIKKRYRSLMEALGMDKEAIQKVLNKTSNYEDYNSYPAETLLEVLCDAEICGSVDWKFGLEDVEYQANLIAKKLGMKPVKEYPPQEEGQPLGIEALKQILLEHGYAAAIVEDGDSFYFFLVLPENAEAIYDRLAEIAEFWDFEDFYLMGTRPRVTGDAK